MTHPATGPRLFFSADDLPRLRRTFHEDPRFADLKSGFADCDRAAEREFLREGVNVEDQLHDLRRVCDLVQNMAFLHLMTGDEDAGNLAVEAVRTMMRFPFWDFFLEGDQVIGVQGAPRCTVALAAALDWLGDRVQEEERRVWLEVMAERGCGPCHQGLKAIRFPRQAKPWSINPRSVMHAERSGFPNDSARRPEITQNTNLRAVPAGGLAVGVAALHLFTEAAPEALERWREMAVFSLRVFESVYLPDGSYGEGVNYGNYTSESIILAVVALANAGLEDIRSGINWPGHVRFMLNLSMPTAENPYEVVNIGDSGRHRGQVVFQHPDGRADSRSAVPFWTAREYSDGLAQWFGLHLAAAHNIWSLIFFDDRVEASPPDSGRRTWVSDLDWVVARTGFAADDLLVSLRSGIGWNHEHADRNSLIIKDHGEQLVVDPSRPPYSFTDPCWMMRTTAGHSAVLFDGEGHFYHNGVEGTNSTIAQARLVERGEGEGHSFWISDATQAYRLANLEIKSAVRAVVVFFDLRAVVVVDSLSKWKRPSTMEARFFADNWDGACRVAVTQGGFEIERPHALARAHVFCRTPITVARDLLPIPEERAVKHPFVSVKTEPTMVTTLVSVFGLAPGGGAAAVPAFDSSDSEIRVAFNGPAGPVVCRIGDAGTVPSLRVDQQ